MIPAMSPLQKEDFLHFSAFIISNNIKETFEAMHFLSV
jgi:hypothetical protein